jgi:hypothetical protein
MAAKKNTQKKIEDVYQEALGRFGHRPDVTGIDIGYEYKNGERTETLAVRLHVKEKLPKSVLEASEIFPEEIDGVPLDVIQGNYKPDPVAAPSLEATDRMQRFSRLQPGISVGHPNVTAGTLGLVVKDDRSGRPAILSNWHVLAGSASATPGDPTIQPGSMDGGRVPRDTVAALERMILDRDGDAAIALLTNVRPVDLSICDLGTDVNSIEDTNVGDIVVKSGRTTQVTRGRVDGKGRFFINYSVGRIGIDGFTIVPVDRENPDNVEISLGGDSGSAWLLDGSKTMVGLHFAGEGDPRPSKEHAIACHATRVFSRLRISLLETPERLGGSEENAVVQVLSSQLGEAAASAVFEGLDPRQIRRWATLLERSYPRLAKSDGIIDELESASAAEIGPFGAVAMGFAAGAAARIISGKLESAETVSAEAFPVVVATFLAGAVAGARAVDGKL